MVESVLEKLIVVTAVLLGVAALLACIGVSFVFRELRHTFAAMQTALAGIKNPSESAAEDASGDVEVSDFKVKLGTVTATLEEVMNEIEISATAVDNAKA